ncbi:MAG: DEAD/DEAH box helicase [Polyangiaceae bacterium]|nr:DEAD/DEAH box helicase [Polyangiaceae bacterium]
MSSEATEATEAPPTFDVLPLSSELRRAVDDLGYTHPTPVQRAVFELASRGKDLVVQARTGTGKTAAFGMPIVDSLVRRGTPAVQVLALCPTRELALQVTRELEALAKYRGVAVVPVYGGAPMPRQVEQIRGGAQVVVGTPGRVLDHLRRGTFSAASVRALVLDESDEMLSMGFLPQINEILSYLPDARQTLLFSATLPPDIQRMAADRLKSPEFLTLSGDHIGALEIDHFVYLSFGDKISELLQIIEIEDPESAIVFCNTKDETKRVAAALEQQGFAADWLNADLGQSDREKVMAATRQGALRFLVATDVAARGIDISHLTHVINFDFPESAEQYVHRTGRTGRAGKIGMAVSLVTPSDVGHLYLLRLTYKLRPIEKTLPSARELKTRAEADLVNLFVSAFGDKTTHPEDLALARRLLTHESAEQIVAGLLRDHLGARPDAAEEATAARRARAPKRQAAPAVEEPRPQRPPVREREPAPMREREPAPMREREPERAREREPAPMREREPERAREREPAPMREREPEQGGDRPVERAPARELKRTRDRGESRGREPFRYSIERIDRAERVERIEPDADTNPGKATDTGYDAAEREAPRAEGLSEIFVNVGRRDGATPADFHAVLEAGGLSRDATDYVNVRHRHAFVGTRKELLERVLQTLNGATIAGRTVAAEIARPRP